MGACPAFLTPASPPWRGWTYLSPSKLGASGLPSAAGELLSSGHKAGVRLSAGPATPSGSLFPHLPVGPQVTLHQDRPPPAYPCPASPALSPPRLPHGRGVRTHPLVGPMAESVQSHLAGHVHDATDVGVVAPQGCQADIVPLPRLFSGLETTIERHQGEEAWLRTLANPTVPWNRLQPGPDETE